MKFVITGLLVGALVLLLFILKDLVLATIRRRMGTRHDQILHAVSSRHPEAKKKLTNYERNAKRWYGDDRAYMSSQLIWGLYHSQVGAYEDSIAANEMAIKIEGGLQTDHWRVLTDAYESLANSFSLLGRFDEAHIALDGSERTLRAKKDAPAGDAAITTAMEMRARVAKREGDHTRSAELLERLCSLFAAPSQPAGPYRGLPQQPPIDTLREALDPVETRLRLANALFTLGRVEDAKHAEQDALASASPEKVDLTTYRAALRYVREGNSNHALRLLKHLLHRVECNHKLRVLAAALAAYLDVATKDALPTMLKILEETDKSTPEYARLRRAGAFLHFEADQIEEGVSLLGAIPSDTHPSLLLAYSAARWRHGERADAEETIAALEHQINVTGPAILSLQIASWQLHRGAISEAQRALNSADALALTHPLSVGAARLRTILKGAILQVSGRFDDAAALYKTESREEQPLLSRGMALHGLGALHATCGRYSLAQEHFEDALAIYERDGEETINVERVLVELCDAQLRSGDPRVEQVYARLQHGFRAQDRTSKSFRLRVDARRASRNGAHEDALMFAQEALEYERRNFGELSPTIPESYVLLSNVCRASGQVENAARAAEDAVRTAVTLFGKDHPTSAEAIQIRDRELQ